jgi:hypothetical protein
MNGLRLGARKDSSLANMRAWLLVEISLWCRKTVYVASRIESDQDEKYLDGE